MSYASPKEFVDYYEKIRSRTIRVIECIPRNHIDWTYKDGKFTFADLIRHIAATERLMFAECVRMNPPRYQGHGRELADGYEAVMEYFQRMNDESIEIFRGLDDEQFRQKCRTPTGSPIGVWKWLRAMIEHEIHHRGQIYTMLGMMDVTTPPLYGLTSEEVRDMSEPHE